MKLFTLHHVMHMADWLHQWMQDLRIMCLILITIMCGCVGQNSHSMLSLSILQL